MVKTATNSNGGPGRRMLGIPTAGIVTLALALGQLLVSEPAPAADSPLEVKMVARTPEQMSAFYEARGFPPAMVKLLAQQCFITVRIHNRGPGVVWLDLSRWHFSTDGRPVRRYHRNDWKEKWKEMNIPLASQSTFRWTLLPEELDYQPGEAEGGNVVVQRVSTPLSLVAEFETGADRRGPLIRLQYDNLRCAEDTP